VEDEAADAQAEAELMNDTEKSAGDGGSSGRSNGTQVGKREIRKRKAGGGACQTQGKAPGGPSGCTVPLPVSAPKVMQNIEISMSKFLRYYVIPSLTDTIISWGQERNIQDSRPVAH